MRSKEEILGDCARAMRRLPSVPKIFAALATLVMCMCESCCDHRNETTASIDVLNSLVDQTTDLNANLIDVNDTLKDILEALQNPLA